ncbi:MAG: 7-carboxy-7-deazaguanine synthase [Proteobacteria bacterium]|nr:7-carboxy-7-deazaguanine synthase [Pseudomonadota bacterium]
MGYAVKEIFFSIQGEGFHTGKPTVFCRFSGCNLWSGLEKHRSKAMCTFCDTDFLGTDGTYGGKYKKASELAAQIKSLWPKSSNNQHYVVFTGGEPTLQLDSELIDACKALGLKVGIETNGTREVPEGVDWICVSPKPNAVFKQTFGDELKLVYPQKEENMTPEHFERLNFKHFFLQPMDGSSLQENTDAAVEYCMQKPQWNLSVQLHKMLQVR